MQPVWWRVPCAADTGGLHDRASLRTHQPEFLRRLSGFEGRDSFFRLNPRIHIHRHAEGVVVLGAHDDAML